MLAIVAAMQRGAEPNKESDLIIMVPSYDPAEIFSPSYGHDEPEPARESASFPSLRCVPSSGPCAVCWLPREMTGYVLRNTVFLVHVWRLDGIGVAGKHRVAMKAVSCQGKAEGRCSKAGVCVAQVSAGQGAEADGGGDRRGVGAEGAE